jgi:endonuclease/exonuclease/phosphatase family metal-dependent hydrolase
VRVLSRYPVCGRAADHTYDTTANPLAAASSSGAFRNALDHVWLLRPMSGSTLHSHPLCFTPGLEASDHYPVLATITAAPVVEVS